MTTWEEIFAPIDRIVADMPPVERACSTCFYAEIPPMPEDPRLGWVAHCMATLPVNASLNPTRAIRSFAAADAARWESKRQQPCPAWKEKQDSILCSRCGKEDARHQFQGQHVHCHCITPGEWQRILA